MARNRRARGKVEEAMVRKGYQLCPICCEYELLRGASLKIPYLVKCLNTCASVPYPVPPKLLGLKEPIHAGHSGDRYAVDMRRPR